MSLSQITYALIPLIGLMCNVFLLLTLWTAKKSSVIYSFMALLIAFILWTGGSLFMRLEMYPGIPFWFEVSFNGICLVPYLYFLLVCTYGDEKATFTKYVWGLLTVAVIVLNQLNVFFSDPVIVTINGEKTFQYVERPWLVLLFAYAVGMLLSIVHVMVRSMRKGSLQLAHFRPLIVGFVGMLLVMVVDFIPIFGSGSQPTDSLACAFNAICIYYALYKKRICALSQMTSKGATYLISAILTVVLLVISFDTVDTYFGVVLPPLVEYKSLFIAVLFSLLGILIFNLLNALHESLFVKDQIERENKLRNFSLSINKTLELNEIVVTYVDFLRESSDASQIQVCLHSPEEGCFRSTSDYMTLNKRFMLREDNSLIQCMQDSNRAVVYSEFMQTTYYKSMWEAEKLMLQSLGVALILPLKCDDVLVGITFLSEKINKRPYRFDEINFMESVVSIVSIAIKNANLYETIHREAQRDSLTGLYNRRYFNQHLEEDFQRARAHSITVILFNLDDFRLYNELYGSGEGDRVLQHFAHILQSVFGSRGTVARYGGKEFAVILPFCGASTGEDMAQMVQSSFASYLAQLGGASQRFLTFSAGICSYPTSAANADQLLSYANLAVYTVKKNGKNRILTYTRNAGAEAPTTARSKASIVQEYTSTIYALTAAIDAKDHYTFSHSQCVSSYAAQLAAAAGLSEEHVEIIRQAGLLHDIGKIGIPDSILSKEGKLTPEEFVIMRGHVERSIEMIRHLPSLDYVIPVVLAHHERFDGKGYPRGIAGENIPIGARCLTIVDAFDAMVSRRSYKEVMPLETALYEIRSNLGRQFDPELGQLFVSMIESGQIQVVSY